MTFIRLEVICEKAASFSPSFICIQAREVLFWNIHTVIGFHFLQHFHIARKTWLTNCKHGSNGTILLLGYS